MLAVTTAPYGLIVIRMDEATLSQRLHTPPLPVTHTLVGYRWQYIGLCPVEAGTTALQATSRRTFAYPPEKVYWVGAYKCTKSFTAAFAASLHLWFCEE